MAERKTFLLRIDPDLWDALQQWAADELRSVNGQMEFLLAQAVRDAGRAPRKSRAKGREAPPSG